MRYKFFNKPKFHDTEFYKTRKLAPHIDERRSNLRIEISAALASHLIKFYSISNVFDLGCGDGGLISLLAMKFPKIEFIGYDLQPSNIEHAQKRFKDLGNAKVILNDCTKIDFPRADLTCMTEVLEHLVEPEKMLEKINSPFLIVSTPIGESSPKLDITHLWGWDREDCLKMFLDTGWKVIYYAEGRPIQYFIAKKL